MTSQLEGWRAYHQGDYQTALQRFSTASSLDAIAGQGVTLVAMGRNEEAIASVRRHMGDQTDLDWVALLADVVGRTGGRGEAERLLSGLVQQRPQRGLYRSLLGEQRIRQGKWDEGTNDFIAAMEIRDERTFAHLQRVLADMIDAVAARRIPTKDGMRLINRIDYSSAKKTQEISSFFAAARRAINGNRRMERDAIIEHWSMASGAEAQPVFTASAATQAQQPQQAQQPSRPAQRPAQPTAAAAQAQPPQAHPARERRPTTPESQPSIRSSAPRMLTRPSTQSQTSPREDLRQRLAQRTNHVRPPDLVMDAQLKDMTAILREERHLNECLQELVAATPQQYWPSQRPQSIDNVPPIGFSTRPILRGSRAINNSNFRLTAGDILVEITLERCMNNLLAAAHSLKPVNLPLAPRSISRLELNLQDNFIEGMPSLEALYEEEVTVENETQLAVGKFIGECIVQCYGAVWEYTNPPQQSKVRLGSHYLDPMKIAGDFLSARSFDEVDMRVLIDGAEEAIETSISLPSKNEHIDPTPGLEREALAMSLAEMWAEYRFDLAETDILDIAATIELIEVGERVILFQMGANFVPPALVSGTPGAVNAKGLTAMAYDRQSGAFLVLASRKHFVRMLERVAPELSAKTAANLARMVRLFRPGWLVATDTETAAKASERFNINLEAPQFRQQDGAADIRLQVLNSQRQLEQIDLRFRANRRPAYQLVGG